MAVRPTMQTAIIPAIRDLIADTSGSPTFSDQQVQDAADESRADVYYELLKAVPTITNDGTTGSAAYVWIDYYSQFKFWEIGQAVTQYGDFTARSPVATEYIIGHWQFSYLPTAGVLPPNSASPGQYPPIFVTGRSYDIYAAAVKLLQLLKAKNMLTAYNFTDNGQNFSRGQIIANIDGLIKDYCRKIRPRKIPLRRSDSAQPVHTDVPIHKTGLEDRTP